MSGVIGATQAICYAAVCLLSAGFVARAKNGLNFAVLGLFLFITFFCLVPFSRNAIVCGALATVAVGSLALVWPAVHAWIGAEPDLALRARHMARLNVSWSTGFAISPLFTGPLYDYDYRLPFIMIFAVAFGAMLILRFLPHESEHFGVASQEMLDARADHDRSSEMYLYSAWFATAVGNFLSGITRTVYPKRIDELVEAGQLRLLFEDTPPAFLNANAATKYSWLAFALAAIIALTFMWMGRSRWWHHKFQFLFALQIGAAIAFYVLGETHSLVIMAACFMAVGINGGVAFFAGVYYSMADPAQKHRRAAINEGAVGIGGFLGSISFGYMAGRYGIAFPCHLTPIFIAAGLAAQLFLLRYGRHRLQA
jgi:MFS family permease